MNFVFQPTKFFPSLLGRLIIDETVGSFPVFPPKLFCNNTLINVPDQGKTSPSAFGHYV